MFDFEHQDEPLVSPRRFYWRMARAFGVTLLIVAGSLGMGVSGYRYINGLPWIDALYNSAMILTGMGPADAPRTAAGKLFATFYALYSGIAFLSMVAVLMAPVVHRAMHKFHLDVEEDEKD